MSAEQDHEQVQPLLSGYALGSLEEDERVLVEQHLDDCQICQAELEEHQAVTVALLEIPAPVKPRRLLRQALADAVRPHALSAPSPPGWRRAAIALAASVVVVLVGMGFLASQLSRLSNQLSSIQSDISTNQTALAITSYPTTQVASLEGEQAFGTFMFDPTRTIAVLYAWGLRDDSGEATYSAWLADSQGQRVKIGEFTADDNGRFTMVVLRAPEPIEGFQAVGVSRLNGSGGPVPLEPVLFASLEVLE